ncbi:MAG: hypothetical protein KJ916_05905 [Alphaproteobacteria bacterium]|nr:hypothetical protein [Alphaproteobacteria bacterium]
MNPAGALATEDAARAAAQVSAIGMVIGAIHTAVGAWYASTPAASEATARVIEEFTGQAPEPAQLASQAQMGLYLAGALVVLQLILAAVQWRKPNVALPILFLVLVVWGLGGSILALVMPMFGGGQPMWLTLFTLVTMLIAAIMHIAGIRGASALGKFRDAQAY